ncbi:MAG TPA: tyrosinase family protein [Flavisolibacter sp.]|nr:tyrosinase family protein [Flavisolibacter sp.]
MKKWSILVFLFALLFFSLFAFRTIAPKTTVSTVRATLPVFCAPITSNSINAIPFSFAKYTNGNILTRRNIYHWSEADFEDYKRAIVAMRALPYNDPTSWEYQSAIHGTTLTNNLQSWNSCQHGTRFFFSWHRMYIYFFERIVRAKSGNPSFTMPYWDYQTNPVLPPAFRDNTPGNPLYDSTRYASINGGGALPSSISTSINNALNNVLFDDYQTRIEGPHGAVHNAIGGNMRLIRASGKDPIFYLHHTNIDRLWDVWLWRCGGRATPTASDATWWNQRFTFFDENGRAVVMTGSQIVDIASQLNYRYETPAPFTTTITRDTITTSGSSTQRIQAENYTSMSGISTTSTSDEGGGRVVTNISSGDYMNYRVNVPTAGSYRMTFRVAKGSSSSTSQLQVRNSSGNRLATVNIPYTGGSNIFTTINTTLTLPAGSQTLRIYSNYGGWVFNWFEIVSSNSTNNTTVVTTTTTPCGTTTSRLMDYASLKWDSYELLKLKDVTRINQKLTQLSLANANMEGLKTYLNKTNNSPFRLSERPTDDKLFADIELLKASKLPEGVVEVYLNLPAGTTPSANSIYFADVLNLFGASDHIHHNEKGANIISVDLTTAAAAQGLSPRDVSKSKLTFYVRGNQSVNGKEIQASIDAQLGKIVFRIKKSQK